MGPGMFDGLVEGLLVMGIVIGVVFCGVGALLFWLFSHIDISIVWVP